MSLICTFVCILSDWLNVLAIAMPINKVWKQREKKVICLCFHHIPAIECPRLTAPTEGFVDYSPSNDTFPYDYLTIGTFRCRFGYRLSGGNSSRTCIESSTGSGEWNGTNPVCEGL